MNYVLTDVYKLIVIMIRYGSHDADGLEDE
jgi:hypothetical protein